MAPLPELTLESILRFLLMAAVGAFMMFFIIADEPLGQGGGAAGAPLPGPTLQVFHLIESVEPVVTDGALSVRVSGTQSDGCMLPVIVDQAQSADTVTLAIYREVPVDVFCTMQLVIYNETIPLDGVFSPGVPVTIVVNGVQATVTP